MIKLFGVCLPRACLLAVWWYCVCLSFLCLSRLVFYSLVFVGAVLSLFFPGFECCHFHFSLSLLPSPIHFHHLHLQHLMLGLRASVPGCDWVWVEHFITSTRFAHRFRRVSPFRSRQRTGLFWLTKVESCIGAKVSARTSGCNMRCVQHG